ncbi:hypothetical protein [Nocardioides sp.]|uniref:hypothetical protein n=1 Tax=Nocardioides sp. TaxID=35761 RepID=UPI002C648577|nr:hypothetical protein [Nocardioides sp.]HVX55562.1 hypothetical protein [Nocardioides sp.]
MDDVAWGALALALTMVSGCVTWIRAQRHGAAAAVRWAGITLLPLAAYFTHTLRLLGRIGTAVGDWAVGFVWNPFVWLGLVMAVLGIGLIGVSSRLPGGRSGRDSGSGPGRSKGEPRAVRSRQPEADLGLGDDLDDIQAILRKHGIS